MKYLYDLHCHTSEGSKCGASSVKELLEYYKNAGFSGFCITDHFTGNSTVPEGAPWRKRVESIWNIYDGIRNEAERLGVSVFPAMEYSMRSSREEFLPVTGNDFVVLGLTKEWLLENEAAFDLDFDLLCDEIHKAGGFIIHAHPFLEGHWIKSIILYPHAVDAVEIYNGHAGESVNAAAKWYAAHYGLLEVAGSDNHRTGEDIIAGVETERKCETVYELIEEIKAGRAAPFMRGL